MSAPGPRKHGGLRLLDMTALVVGYSLAALLFRAFWSSADWPDPAMLFVLALAYLWLGMAMSGPFLIWVQQRERPSDPDDDRPPPRTWAELAWLIIGFYWIGLTVLVVPIRLRDTRMIDTAVLGVFPILAAIGLRIFGKRHLEHARPSWTHRAAIVLLLTWPLAWVALILLGKTLL